MKSSNQFKTGLGTEVDHVFWGLTDEDRELLATIALLPSSIVFDTRNLPNIKVIIDFQTGTPSEISTLQNFISYFRTTNETRLTYVLMINDPFSNFYPESYQQFSPTFYVPMDFLNLDLTKLETVLRDIKQVHILNNIKDWCREMYQLIQNAHSIQPTDEFFDSFMKKISFLASIDLASIMRNWGLTPETAPITPDLINLLLGATLELLIKFKKVSTEFGKVDEQHWINMLAKYPDPSLFLYSIFHFDDVEGYDVITSLIGRFQLIDQDGKTLLHYANRSPLLLQKALQLTHDINTQDRFGNTPLHSAAMTGNLEKAHFLLTHGADPFIRNNQNETFYDVKNEQLKDLDWYRLYYQQGIVLKRPLKINEQEGYICGILAAFAVSNYHRERSPTLFATTQLPLKKRYANPRANTSLLSECRKKNFTLIGELFSAKHLAQVVAETECEPKIHQVDTYNQFITIVSESLERDQPVIFPFAIECDMPAKQPTSNNFHWATIIGYRAQPDRFLVAQYGQYYEMNAQEVFHAFINIPKTSQACYLYKSGRKWCKSNDKQTNIPPNTKEYYIPSVSLNDFRGHVVSVAPPAQNTRTFVDGLQRDEKIKHRAV